MNEIIIKITALFMLVVLPANLLANVYSFCSCNAESETIDIELTHDCCPQNDSEQRHSDPEICSKNFSDTEICSKNFSGPKIYPINFSGPQIYLNYDKDDENNREKCLSCIYKKIMIENSNISKVIFLQNYIFLNILTDYVSINYPDTAYKIVLKQNCFLHCPSFYDPVFTVLRI